MSWYEDAYASPLLLATFRANPQWGERERGLITNLVYTVLTHSLRLEAFINRYATIPVRRMKPQVAVVLMVSAAQLLWMDRIPPHAVVDEAVKLILASPQRNLSGFVNGVLGYAARKSARVLARGERGYAGASVRALQHPQMDSGDVGENLWLGND